MTDQTPAEKARALLEKNTGSPIERALVLATLAVAEAIDGLTEELNNVTEQGESHLWVRVVTSD